MRRAEGSFSERGPAPYLTDDPDECRALLEGPLRPKSTWFHGTTETVARIACSVGLVPGCWLGAGRCAVMGYSSRDEFLLRAGHLWIVEVETRALEGDVKAWWVPPEAIVGVWSHDVFFSKDELLLNPAPVPPLVDGCACGLSDVCRQEQKAWRRNVSPYRDASVPGRTSEALVVAMFFFLSNPGFVMNVTDMPSTGCTFRSRQSLVSK